MPLGEGLRLIDSFLTGARLRKDIKLIAAGKVRSSVPCCDSSSRSTVRVLLKRMQVLAIE